MLSPESPETTKRVSSDEPKGFWANFDEMGEEHIAEMAKSLNTQLDQQIIFATLFSAINSAFLIYSLPNLSDPVQQTNEYLFWMVQGYNNSTMSSQANTIAASGNTPLVLNIVINQLFSASLTCSLIAAFFAVLGKQWLTYFTKPTRGSPDAVRRDIQSRILGAEMYKFRTVLEAALPLIFQASLLLFLVGLVIFLFTINKDVAYAVIPLAALGLIAYIIFVILALWDPACPYQTPITETLIPAIAKVAFHLYLALRLLLVIPAKLLRNIFDTLWPGLHWGFSLSKQRPGINDLYKSAASHAKVDWDVNYHRRLALAKKLRRSRSISQTNIMTAAWVVRTSQEDDDARMAAETFLVMKRSAEVALLGDDKGLIRRLRDLVRLTDDDLAEESARAALSGNRLERIKSRDWPTLCFYIAVLTHIFLSLEGPNAQWYDTMYKIYLYQSRCADAEADPEHDKPEGNRERGDVANTQCRMWGILKLLLYYETHPEVRSRFHHWNVASLYDEIYHGMTIGPGISTVSKAAFAMSKLIPRQRLRLGAIGLALLGPLGPSESRSPSVAELLQEAKEDHMQLWSAYTNTGTNPVENIVNFLNKFAEHYPFSDFGIMGQNPLHHFYKFLDAIERATLDNVSWSHVVGSTRSLITAYANVIHSFRNFRTNNLARFLVTWIVPLELDKPVVDLMLKTVRKAMQNTPNVIDQLQSIAEACRTLVELHTPLERVYDPEVIESAISAMEMCRNAIRTLMKGPSQHGIFIPLLQATGTMVQRCRKADKGWNGRGGALIALGVQVIGDFIQVCDPKHFRTDRLQNALASPEGIAAMAQFVRSNEERPGLSEKESQFIQGCFGSMSAEPSTTDELVQLLHAQMRVQVQALRASMDGINQHEQVETPPVIDPFPKKPIRGKVKISTKAPEVRIFAEDEPADAIKDHSTGTPIERKQEDDSGASRGEFSKVPQDGLDMV